MKSTYETPVINRLQSQRLNKFGLRATPDVAVRTLIDGVAIGELTERFGSPLFVYSERTLRKRFRQFYQAFSTRYPDVLCGWSYKTNYLSAICRVMHQEGAVAEVVSAMEYEMAESLGVAGRQIIFNGPHKPLAALERAVAAGARINVDHFDELADVAAIADRREKGTGVFSPLLRGVKSGRCDGEKTPVPFSPVGVGLRLNLDAGIVPQWSRFGFNLESGQALMAVRRLAQAGNLRLAGLHCHIGTYILDPAAYGRQVEKMLDFAYEIEDRFGYRIEYLDLGGGFPSHNKLKGTYLAADVAVPAIDEYAEVICDALHSKLRAGHHPQLILESGRALVDEAGYMITSVVAAKRLADGMRAYVVDGGINLLYTAFWYNFRLETDTGHSGLTEPSVVYGPLCMNIDVVNDRIDLPPLRRGQRLIVSPVGAYNNTQWMQFIEYRPRIVLIGDHGNVEVIREREDLSDIRRREVLPERLKMRDQG